MVCATDTSSQKIIKLDIMAPHKTAVTCMKQEQPQHEQGDMDMAMEEDDESEEDSSQDEMAYHTSILKSENYPHKEAACKQQRPPVSQPLFLNFTSDLSPQKMSKKKSKSKKQTAYRVNGVNILNRNELDSKTAIERIQRRRENHNHVERRRRDNINNTIFELSTVVPNAIKPGQKPNKGNILKLSLDYIKKLKAENEALKQRLYQSTSTSDISADGPFCATNNDNENGTIKSVLSYRANASQASPSAPTSPQHYGFNNSIATPNHTLTMQQAASMPNSPVFSGSNINNSSSNNMIHHHQHQHTLPPPPLSLPPPPPPSASHSHQQMQHIFSNMTVSSPSPSSNKPKTCTSFPSSSSSSPMLVTTATPPTSAVPPATTGYPSYFTPPPTTANTRSNSSDNVATANITSFPSIPQPPTLYNHNIDHSNNLRPLLPATNKSAKNTAATAPPFILPLLRMSGSEKIYGNVCRY